MDGSAEGWRFLWQELGLDTPVLGILTTVLVLMFVFQVRIKRLFAQWVSAPIVKRQVLEGLDEIIARERAQQSSTENDRDNA